jgi:hypothetical protein
VAAATTAASPILRAVMVISSGCLFFIGPDPGTGPGILSIINIQFRGISDYIRCIE